MFNAYQHLLPGNAGRSTDAISREGDPSTDEVREVASQQGHYPFKQAMYSALAKDDTEISLSYVEIVSWPYFTEGKVVIHVRTRPGDPASAIWVDANLITSFARNP